ncbi:M23 family metallopeptidase [Leucobacter luti]|uniref:M23 family metallopeptidase n=1 Tax=Leucobacter luti TaxID=340320 RepID=UPI001C68CF74|nr:M23 family metallopeptidase [Leucobacter luti]QYM75962.1 M23 family metallopeptidase [Leucobacter luti]
MSHVLLAAYRIRFPFIYAATVALIAVAIAAFIPMNDSARAVRTAIWGCAMGVLILGISITMLGGRRLPDRRTIAVTAPVRGRWLALNSPASAVPSHGVRTYGQTYAIDLVAEPLDRDRPEFASGPMMRPAPEYPAFGEPVRAMIDGTVVRASDWRRDHRARSHWPGLLYLTAEGAIRELGGPGFVVGNHVVIRGHGESRQVFAVVAHLQRGSVTVRVGDTVRAGDKIGRCGNSGNSTEPHVHAQLMDRASAWTGQGIPLEFSDITVGESEERITGMPQNEQHMTS